MLLQKEQRLYHQGYKMKETIKLKIVVKSRTGNHFEKIDSFEDTPNKAVQIITKKYCKGLWSKLGDAFEESAKELENFLKK